MMSVIFDLAVHTMPQELQGDKVDEDPPVMPDRCLLVGARKTERQ
jgi:hypothetical protein